MSAFTKALPNARIGAAFDLSALLRRTEPQAQIALPESQRLAALVKKEFTALRESAFPLRTQMFDEEVTTFLLLNPEGTVVQIGGGVHHRYSRLDNGTAHWVDVDFGQSLSYPWGMPEEQSRVQTVQARAAGERWFQELLNYPGPYCFVLGNHPGCLVEADVEMIVKALGRQFPGAWMVMDLGSASTAKVSNERQLVRLLLHACTASQVGTFAHRLPKLGAIVDRTRTLLDFSQLGRIGLPGWCRIAHHFFPRFLRARFSEYQILRIVFEP